MVSHLLVAPEFSHRSLTTLLERFRLFAYAEFRLLQRLFLGLCLSHFPLDLLTKKGPAEAGKSETRLTSRETNEWSFQFPHSEPPAACEDH